jgi:hypothetical protein
MANRDPIQYSTQNSKLKTQNSSTFLARFGQVIVRHGIAAIPAALYYYQGELQLSAQEVWFISSVLSHKWTEDMPHPNLKRMERETGVQERTLRRYKQRLTASGYLRTHPRYDDNGRQDSNYYDFSSLFGHIRNQIKEEARQSNPISADGPSLVGARQDDEEEEGQGGEGTSFVARYGAVIVSKGIAAVPQAVFTYGGELGLTPQQVWFVCYIFSVPWSPPYPYPSIIKMAARTGYSKMQLHEIKSSLVERGYLQLVHRTKQDGGQDSNGYDFAGLFEALRDKLQAGTDAKRNRPQEVNAGEGDRLQGPGATIPHRPMRQGSAGAKAGAAKRLTHAQQVAGKGLIEEADKELTGVGDNSYPGEGDSKLTVEGANRLSGMGDEELTRAEGGGLTAPVNKSAPTRLSRTLPGWGSESGHESESSPTEKQGRDDSNHFSPVENKDNGGGAPSSSVRFSPYIMRIVTDFSDELGDSTHVTANVGQALRIYTQSDMDELEFADLLFEARKTVRARQGQQGLGTINNKMAYFFVVLRDLLRRASDV